MTPLERIGWGFIGGRRSSKAILLGHLPRQPASRNVGLSPTAKVLGPETWPVWLGEEPADARQLKAMLAPYPSEEMTCWPVSPRVGNVKNNDPSLIEAISAQ